MRFLSPQFLPWLWLALLPVVLHLFRRRSRTVRVSTLLFFDSLVREHQESAWLRWLKRWLSLLLSLLILSAPIFALTRLVAAGGATEARSLVIALDRSASMGAADDAGQTRLEAARAWLRTWLAGVPESVPVALVAYDGRPDIVHPKSTNRRALLRALEEVAVRPVEDDAAAALAAAGRIAGLETPAEIWHLSDGESAGLPALPAGVTRSFVSFAAPQPVNAGITAFSIKKLPLAHARYQAYVQVALNADADGPRAAVLEPQVGGLPLARRQLDLQPGVPQGLTFEIDAAQDQVLEVSLLLEGDRLAADNQVAARLPTARPLVVAWFSPKPDPFTELALKALATEGELDIFAGRPEQWPPAQLPDVALFENWLPDTWPDGLPAVVLDPPGSGGPIRAVRLERPVPRDDLRVVDDSHPVLFRVSTSRVTLTQTVALDAGGAWQPLWQAGDQPVLLAGEHDGRRVVVLGGAPGLSERLPLTPAFPLLLANSLGWCAEKSAAARAPAITRPGTLIPTSGQSLEWRAWRDGRLAAPVLQPSEGKSLVELDRLGLWRLADGSLEGATALLSRHETDLGAHLPTEEAASPHAEADAAAATAPEPFDTTATMPPRAPTFAGELTRWFIILALLALLLESWLFHRHAVA